MNTNASPAPFNGSRRVRLVLLALVVALALGSYGVRWATHGRWFEHTDDAYIATDLVQITSEIAGTVIALHADDTQHVERGQVLLELDPRDARIALDAADAELARSVRQVRGLFAQADALRAQIRTRQVALDAARGDLKRRMSVADAGVVSVEELQHARDQVAQQETALDAANESLTAELAQIDGVTLEDHPLVHAAAARVREAALALERTKVMAPVSGTIARRGVQIGQRIAPGAPLMAVAVLDNAWVDANFKEVQLEHMRIGQPVELHSDLYGKNVPYHGKIAGLGAGSGSAFALLPAQNASGNWIKIVQRVPVRITLDPKELAQHPLRVGLSMTAQVDLHDDSGSVIATQVRAEPQQTPVNEARDADIDARIAAIVTRNGGTRVNPRSTP